jgi:hypothetical protein
LSNHVPVQDFGTDFQQLFRPGCPFSTIRRHPRTLLQTNSFAVRIRNNHSVAPAAADLLKEGKGIAMRKRKGNVSEEVVQAPKEQEVPPYQSWQPSRLKTGIKNRPVGKKIFVR